MLTESQALDVVTLNDSIKKESHNLNSLLDSTVGTTFASMVSVTDVALAAAHKKAGIVVKKVVQSTIIVANNLQESTNLYTNKVMRTVDQSPNHDDKPFVFSGSNYERVPGDAYSVISLRSNNDKKYLEAFPQATQGVHYIKIEGGEVSAITKDELVNYLTPSAAKKLFEDKSVVYNVKNDVTHSAVYRAYKVESIHSLKLGGKTYVGTFNA